MGLFKLSLGLLALAGSALSADVKVEPVEIKGSKFFFKNGTQFFMKGIAYQQDIGAAGADSGGNATKKYTDPLSDEAACNRDVPLLAELGTNVIRTYAIDPTADHSACMKMLQKSGIYVIADLGEPSMSINRDEPQWNTELFSRYKKVIDEMGQYANVIGFFAGNEVSNAKNNTGASAYVKAAVRDSKAYIKTNKKLSHTPGVGYAANDDKDIRRDIADYFNCNTKEEAIDFWGYNIYSWCGKSDMKKSGYDEQVKFFKEYSVPVFFAEYGCNSDGAAERLFQETAALYSSAMTPVFSGGIVYMYFQEANDYGLVKAKGKKAEKVDDFDTLKKQVLKADPKGVDMDKYTPSGKMSDCPKVGEKWAAGKELPPTPDQDLCDCMYKSRTCVPTKDLDKKSFGKIFNFICDKDPKACKGINGNATLGVYGAYSMCDDRSKLAYVLDTYYNNQKKAKDACDFEDKATTQTPASESSCAKSLQSASAINKAVATATGPVGSSVNATATGESFAGRGVPVAHLFSVGDFAFSAYMLAAVGVGAGMVAL